MNLITLALVVLTADPEVEAPKPQPPPALSFTVSLGSSHWVGQTFGTPIGLSTPALTLGIHPGLRWLEVGLRYALAIAPLQLPDGRASRVGFVSLELLLTKEMRVADQRFVLAAGPAAAVLHSAAGAGFGAGPVLLARYLIDVGARLSIGPFFAMRAMFYGIPGDAAPFSREDLQGDLGVAAVF